MADEKDDTMALDAAPDAAPIRLLSKDDRAFEVDRAHTTISKLVVTTLESDSAAAEIPIPGVDGTTLELVVSYMNHHKGTEPDLVEKPLRSKVMSEVVKDAWDAEFIDKVGENRKQLYDLILAANYLDIQGLLHLGAAKVASLIKGQPLDQIKTILDPNAEKAE